jgi:hypothetical protein
LLSGSLSSLGAVVESCYGDISFALYERKHLLPASELVYIASVSTLGKKNRPSHPSRTESETAHVMRFRTLIALFHTVILVSNCFLFFCFCIVWKICSGVNTEVTILCYDKSYRTTITTTTTKHFITSKLGRLEMKP